MADEHDQPGNPCLCATCRRPVAGSSGDIKVCVVHSGEPLVLCSGCFRRDRRRARWLEWHSVALSEPSERWRAAADVG